MVEINADEYSLRVTDASGRVASFKADIEKHEWIPDDEVSTDIVKRNLRDIELMAAIEMDLADQFSSSQKVSQSQQVSATSTCYCNYMNPKRGDCAGLAASLACNCATQEVNHYCWNNYCIGCCSFLECDVTCFPGTSYLCIAGRTGYPCNPC